MWNGLFHLARVSQNWLWRQKILNTRGSCPRRWAALLQSRAASSSCLLEYHARICHSSQARLQDCISSELTGFGCWLSLAFSLFNTLNRSHLHRGHSPSGSEVMVLVAIQLKEVSVQAHFLAPLALILPFLCPLVRWPCGVGRGNEEPLIYEDRNARDSIETSFFHKPFSAFLDQWKLPCKV